MSIEERMEELERIIIMHNETLRINSKSVDIIIVRLIAAEQRLLIVENDNYKLKRELEQKSLLN